MGVLKFLVGLTIAVATTSFLILIIPGIPPNVTFESFSIKHPKKEYLDLLNSNSVLDEAEIYYESSHDGVESVVVLEDDSIITTDQSGAVFRITGPHTAVNVTHLKYPCADPAVFKGKDCSWPLGLRKDLDGNILLMDSYGGMTKVYLKQGTWENIIPKHKPIDGFVSDLPEDLDITKEGIVYWTDGCTKGDTIHEWSGKGQPSGRLIKYDPAKKTNQVLLRDLHFSNGVCLSEAQDFVLVSESASASIRRYYLKDDKKGTSDIFVDGLPGYPDNIRPNGRGGFFVALFSIWNDEYSMQTHILSESPLLRKFIHRVQFLLMAMANQIKTVFPDNLYLKEFEEYVQQLRPILRFHQIPKTAIIVELSNTGKVLNIFRGNGDNMWNLSQITIGKKFAYMVSPFANKVWRIKLDKLRT